MAQEPKCILSSILFNVYTALHNARANRRLGITIDVRMLTYAMRRWCLQLIDKLKKKKKKICTRKAWFRSEKPGAESKIMIIDSRLEISSRILRKLNTGCDVRICILPVPLVTNTGYFLPVFCLNFADVSIFHRSIL